MKMPKSKFFRSFLYFVVVGGLLVLSSLLIEVVWNSLIIKFDYKEINYLESVGINAILYVFVYAIGYGYFGAQTNLKFGNFYDDYIKKLSDAEKEELRNALKKKIAD